MQPDPIEIHAPFCVPVDGMASSYWSPWAALASVTTYHTDAGQLHWPHGDCETVPVLYVEAAGHAKVIPVNPSDRLRAFQVAMSFCRAWEPADERNGWKGPRATVIETRVPKADIEAVRGPLGAAEFIAQRHPSHDVRVQMTKRLMDTCGTPEPTDLGRARVRKLVHSAGMTT